ncbi:MAG: hypothetical protein JNM17_39795 [Archangium sp.]|nr:hypothetical protein [Archangium sp.]
MRLTRGEHTSQVLDALARVERGLSHDVVHPAEGVELRALHGVVVEGHSAPVVSIAVVVNCDALGHESDVDLHDALSLVVVHDVMHSARRKIRASNESPQPQLVGRVSVLPGAYIEESQQLVRTRDGAQALDQSEFGTDARIDSREALIGLVEKYFEPKSVESSSAVDDAASETGHAEAVDVDGRKRSCSV